MAKSGGENTHYKGRWWLPAHHEEVQVGTLEYGPHDGLFLAVMLEGMFGGNGAWGELIKQWNSDSEREPLLIHGQAHSGTPFTLYDGYVKNVSTGFGGSTPARLFFNRGIRGACINDPARVPIDRVYERYYGLEAWLSINPFQMEHEDEPPHDVTVTYKRPTPIEIPIDDNRTFVVRWSRKGPTHSITQNDITITSIPWAGIAYQTPVTIEDADEDSGVIADLLSLLLGQPTTGYELEYRSPEVQETVGEKEYREALHSMGARFRPRHSFETWTSHDVLLPYPRLKGDLFKQLLSRWFALHERSLAVGPYFAEQRSPAPFVNGQFFSYARTAEALHRDLLPDEKLFPDEEAADLRKSIMKNVPESRKEHLRSYLKRVNALSFRHRIERLMAQFSRLSEDVIGNSEDQIVFARMVRDLRDAEAHLLEEKKVGKKRGRAYVGFASKLKVLIDAWLLSEIGLSEQLFGDAMRANRKYWFYANTKTWPWKP